MNVVCGSEVVQHARGWLGTPFCHRASQKGVGCDCLGLLRGIRREMRGADPEQIPYYGPGWAEIDAGERLWQALRLVLHEMSDDADLAAGQVLLFRMRDGAAARHLGILSEDGSAGGERFIHAYERHGVIESPLSAPWRRRIAARFILI